MSRGWAGFKNILKLHEIMMSYAGYEYGGEYKEEDNLIIELDNCLK